jgi:hypothetical protein
VLQKSLRQAKAGLLLRRLAGVYRWPALPSHTLKSYLFLFLCRPNAWSLAGAGYVNKKGKDCRTWL